MRRSGRDWKDRSSFCFYARQFNSDHSVFVAARPPDRRRFVNFQRAKQVKGAKWPAVNMAAATLADMRVSLRAKGL
jgi:hypothetical protein